MANYILRKLRTRPDFGFRCLFKQLWFCFVKLKIAKEFLVISILYLKSDLAAIMQIIYFMHGNNYSNYCKFVSETTMCKQIIMKIIQACKLNALKCHILSASENAHITEKLLQVQCNMDILLQGALLFNVLNIIIIINLK